MYSDLLAKLKGATKMGCKFREGSGIFVDFIFIDNEVKLIFWWHKCSSFVVLNLFIDDLYMIMDSMINVARICCDDDSMSLIIC